MIVQRRSASRINLWLVLAVCLEGQRVWAGSVQGSYNFFVQGGAIVPGQSEVKTDMKITAKAKDGTTFEQEFSFGVGENRLHLSLEMNQNSLNWTGSVKYRARSLGEGRRGTMAVDKKPRGKRHCEKQDNG